MARPKKYDKPSKEAVDILNSLRRLEKQFEALKGVLSLVPLNFDGSPIVCSVDSLGLQIKDMHVCLDQLRVKRNLDPEIFNTCGPGTGK